MGLVRKITDAAFAKYGVNILEIIPAGKVAPAAFSNVGMVADLPWGPVNTITEITSPGQFFATFCPPAFAASDDYGALKALLNKSFPTGFKVVRIAAASAATAAKTYQDNDPANSVTVTANYPGALGNSIYVAWSANADDATARDATVTIGTTYTAFYENVAKIVSTALVVTDPGDPYVTFSKHADGDEVPAAAAASALTGGADGTATAANYVGADDSDVGIRKFYGESVDVNVLFVAECPESLIDDVNTGLDAWGSDTEKGLAILSTPADMSRADAVAYCTYNSDRTVMVYPKVTTVNGYSADREEITVDGNAFAACAIALTPPWLSPGGPSTNGALKWLKGITGLENQSLTSGDYDLLNDAGVAPFALHKSQAFIRFATTTSTNTTIRKIRRRRTADYLDDSIGDFLAEYVEAPLDFDLDTQTLGPVTGPEIGAIKGFLQNEQDKFHIASFSVDPFVAVTAEDKAAGIWTIQMLVETFSDQDRIILASTIGDGVVTTSTS